MDTLTIIETLPDAQAIAPGPDRLYLLSQDRLWAAHPDTLNEPYPHQSPILHLQSPITPPQPRRQPALPQL
ncbi:MAG: hypothetical protein U0401_20530 [Anaerolineae bacterium]